MSGFSSSRDKSDRDEAQQADRRSASLDLDTNNDRASSWGNGVMAEAVRAVEGPMQSPGIGDSFSGITRDLADGPSFGTTGAGRTFSDWSAAGAGAAYGGDLFAGGPFSWSGGFGAGAGGGFGSWDQAFKNEETGWGRTATGVGGSVAAGGRVDSSYSAGGQNLSASGDVYRGVGGNAYSFEDTHATKGTRSGYGVDANYTPLGFNDASVGFSNGQGSAQIGAGNVEVGRVGGFGEAYQTGDGGFGVQGGVNMGRNTATDVTGSLNTGLGQTDAHIGSIGQGRFHNGGVEFGADGSVMGNYSRGGALSVQDASITNTGPLGTTEASLGSYSITKTEYTGGYNAAENQLQGTVEDGNAQIFRDVAGSQTLAGGGSIDAGAGRIQNGTRYNGSGYIDLDDRSAHVQADAEFGGVVADDVHLGAGWDGVYRQDLSAKSVSNATTITNAHADYADGVLSAGVDNVRTGGIRAQGIEGSSQVGGVTTTYGASEISTDHKLDGAYARVSEGEIAAGFAEYDGGGFRVENAHMQSDLGGHGNLEAGGTVGTTSSFKNGEVRITDDAIDAELGSFAVGGVADVSNAYVRAEGPGGSHLDAGLGSYTGGLKGEGLTAHVGADGAAVTADSLAYDAHQITDLHVNSGIDGVYEQNLSVGEAHMHQARVSDLRAGIDASGANLSVGESSYSFAGVSDLNASQTFMDGAVGTEVGIGEASYLGGGVGSAEYQSNFLEGTSSLNATDVNLHGLTASDVNVGANIGDANARIGADSLSVIDANIGEVQTQSSNFGLTQSGTATDVDVGLLRAENLGGGIGWGDQNLLSAHTDIDASVGADRVEGAVDLTQGTASGSIENGRVTAMTDATVGIGDYNVNLGRTGVDANINAGGEIDVFSGTASGQASLAGTELSAFGHSVELGEWAQASGDVDLSRGAVNANLGGENGVGVNASLAEGNLDLNIGGYEIDVDEGIRNVGSAISNTASSAWDSITSW